MVPYYLMTLGLIEISYLYLLAYEVVNTVRETKLLLLPDYFDPMGKVVATNIYVPVA